MKGTFHDLATRHVAEAYTLLYDETPPPQGNHRFFKLTQLLNDLVSTPVCLGQVKKNTQQVFLTIQCQVETEDTYRKAILGANSEQELQSIQSRDDVGFEHIPETQLPESSKQYLRELIRTRTPYLTLTRKIPC